MSETSEPEVPQPVVRAAQPGPSLDSAMLPAEVAPALFERPSLGNTIFIGPNGLRAGWGLLIFLALFIVLVTAASAVAALTFSHFHHPSPVAGSMMKPGKVAFGEGLAALAVILSTWIMAKIERRPFTMYGLAPARWLPRLLAGLAWGFGFLSLLVFTLHAVGLLAFDGRMLFGAAALRSGLAWFAGFFAVGFFEETFFRGYMQFTLARGLNGIYAWFGAPNRQALGFWTSAFLLSFGFALVHKSNAGESPIGLFSAGFIGVVFCLSLWRTGSLWWAIGLHAAWDWAQSFLYGVADSGNMVAGRLFSTHPAGKVILSGGLTGPEGSIFILPTTLLIVAAIVLTLPAQTRRSREDAPHPSPALDLP